MEENQVKRDTNTGYIHVGNDKNKCQQWEITAELAKMLTAVKFNLRQYYDVTHNRLFLSSSYQVQTMWLLIIQNTLIFNILNVHTCSDHDWCSINFQVIAKLNILWKSVIYYVLHKFRQENFSQKCMIFSIKSINPQTKISQNC